MENVKATNPHQTELDLTGMTVGDFTVRRRLGRGGMGQVYLAEQISLKREVALKTLRSDLAANHASPAATLGEPQTRADQLASPVTSVMSPIRPRVRGCRFRSRRPRSRSQNAGRSPVEVAGVSREAGLSKRRRGA